MLMEKVTAGIVVMNAIGRQTHYIFANSVAKSFHINIILTISSVAGSVIKTTGKNIRSYIKAIRLYRQNRCA